MSQTTPISEPAKSLLLASILAKQGTITNNAKAFLKELVLRRDNNLSAILARFQHKKERDADFLEQLHQLILHESASAYNELFSDISLEVGKLLSKAERKEKDLDDDKNLIYGEVDYKSFYAILRKVQYIAGKTFYDLGSGTGKAVFAARMTQDYDRCIGIEILQGLHNQAFKVTERYNAQFRQLLDASHSQHAAVYKGSFLDFDWSDGDVVFANSTCFNDELMDSISKLAEDLKPGAVMVTFTKSLSKTDKFELLEKKREKMSWGPATVFIQRRLNYDGSSVGGSSECLNLLPSDNIEYQESNHDSSEDDKDDDSDSSTGSDDSEDDEYDLDVEEEEEEDSETESSEDDSDSDDDYDGDYDKEEDGSNPFSQQEWAPQPKTGKLSIQPIYQDEQAAASHGNQWNQKASSSSVGTGAFGGGSPLRPELEGSYGFNSPQDAALLRRKAAMAAHQRS